MSYLYTILCVKEETIYVFPVVGNWPMYIVALAVGTVIGAVLLGVLKKPVEE